MVNTFIVINDRVIVNSPVVDEGAFPLQLSLHHRHSPVEILPYIHHTAYNKGFVKHKPYHVQTEHV